MRHIYISNVTIRRQFRGYILGGRPPPHSLAPALMQMKLKKSFGLFCSVLETPTKGENILEEINILF